MFVDPAMVPRLTAKGISMTETQELLDHAAIMTHLAKLPPLTLTFLTADAVGCTQDEKPATAFTGLATPKSAAPFTGITGRVLPVLQHVEVLAGALAGTAVVKIVDASWAICCLEDLAWVV